MATAARLAAKGYPFEVTLVGDGILHDEIEAQIKKNKLEHIVHITGWVSNNDVRSEILNSRIFVLPSFAEGLPVVLMEALALGRPVISTYVAGIPELVRPGRSGWLIPAGSVDALTEAMEAALKAPAEHLEQMAEEGAQLVANHHNASLEAARLGNLFDKLMDPNQASCPPEPKKDSKEINIEE